MIRFLLLVSVVHLSGCLVYPIHKTLQPEAAITVTDDSGVPLEDASVLLISSSYPYGLEKTRLLNITNSQGRASFAELKEWRVEAFIIHGAEVFFWNWCVSKEGFETHLSSWRNGGDFAREYQVSLNQGSSVPCPAKASYQ